MQAADDLITAGNQMIIAPGFKFDEAITKLQEQYPDIKFVMIDGQPEEVCGQPRAKAQARQDAPPLRVPSGRRGQRPFPRAFRRVGQGDQGGVYRFRTFRQGD